jgi:hypothetical protein
MTEIAAPTTPARQNADRQDEMFLTGVGGSQDAMKD